MQLRQFHLVEKSWSGGPGGGAGGGKTAIALAEPGGAGGGSIGWYIAARCRSEPRREWRHCRQCHVGLSAGVRRRWRIWEHGRGWQRKLGHKPGGGGGGGTTETGKTPGNGGAGGDGFAVVRAW